MAVSRPLLLALLGLVLATATLFAARGANQSAADSASTAVAPTPAPTPVSPAPVKKANGPAGPASKGKDTARDDRVEPRPTDDAKPARERNRSTRNRNTPARPPKARAALPAGVPADVGRALRDRKVVVLFLGQGGADDLATAEGVASLRGLKRVAVFRDGIQNLARYRGIVSDLGVAQAPAVVIVGKKRRARLIEGFVDAGTLRQHVVDAR
ncbi:MAG: hypothetical protein H0U14_06730 [Thermoleophilaceae bacterium]|nr:hypothetical protein [Thermoleophilaceae bacterium]